MTTKRFAAQAAATREGILQVLPAACLDIFTENQLDLLVSGVTITPFTLFLQPLHDSFFLDSSFLKSSLCNHDLLTTPFSATLFITTPFFATLVITTRFLATFAHFITS